MPKYCIQIEVTLFLRNKQESTTSTEAYKYWKCIDFIGSAIGDRFLTWGSLARWPMIWQEKRNVKEPIYNLGFPLGRVRGGVVCCNYKVIIIIMFCNFFFFLFEVILKKMNFFWRYNKIDTFPILVVLSQCYWLLFISKEEYYIVLNAIFWGWVQRRGAVLVLYILSWEIFWNRMWIISYLLLPSCNHQIYCGKSNENTKIIAKLIWVYLSNDIAKMIR